MHRPEVRPLVNRLQRGVINASADTVIDLLPVIPEQTDQRPRAIGEEMLDQRSGDIPVGVLVLINKQNGIAGRQQGSEFRLLHERNEEGQNIIMMDGDLFVFNLPVPERVNHESISDSANLV